MTDKNICLERFHCYLSGHFLGMTIHREFNTLFHHAIHIRMKKFFDVHVKDVLRVKISLYFPAGGWNTSSGGTSIHCGEN